MNALLPPSRAPFSRRPLHHAAAALLRLVMADGWRPEPAGRALRALVRGDVQVLRLLRARVARAMLDRPTPSDARALATLEQALAGSLATSRMGWSA
jgi:hypothetical protein